MFRTIPIAVIVTAALGCHRPRSEAPRDEASFGPAGMRIHPVFTRFKDWTGDNQPDGIEAMVEFTDAFGDPTKASGRLLFELFTFQSNQPDPRGRRVANPWIGALQSSEDQRDRWNRASRSYTFPLELPRPDPSVDYVLTAQYDSPDGRRYFGRLILEARKDEFPRRPATQTSIKESARATQRDSDS